jgi:hypothetical protein
MMLAMSEEEQIRLIGRIKHDLGKSESMVSMLKVQLDVLVSDLKKANVVIYQFIDNPTSEELYSAALEIPEVEPVRVACQRLREEAARYQKLKAQASILGI